MWRLGTKHPRPTISGPLPVGPISRAVAVMALLIAGAAAHAQGDPPGSIVGAVVNGVATVPVPDTILDGVIVEGSSLAWIEVPALGAVQMVRIARIDVARVTPGLLADLDITPEAFDELVQTLPQGAQVFGISDTEGTLQMILALDGEFLLPSDILLVEVINPTSDFLLRDILEYLLDLIQGIYGLPADPNDPGDGSGDPGEGDDDPDW